MKNMFVEHYKNIKSKFSVLDMLQIYFSSAIKIIRGAFVRVLLKKTNGLLLVGSSVKITHGRRMIIGKNVKFESGCEIQALALRGIKFGDNVTIGSNSMIRPAGYYGTDIGQGLDMGDNSSIGPFSYVGCAGFINIGKNVMMGPRVSLFAENHNFEYTSRPMKEQGTTQKGINIEDDCWIGSGSIILDGVTIGHGSIIGSGTVVSKSVSPYSVVVGARQNTLYNRKERNS